jgi:hypothetical protein
MLDFDRSKTSIRPVELTHKAETDKVLRRAPTKKAASTTGKIQSRDSIEQLWTALPMSAELMFGASALLPGS